MDRRGFLKGGGMAALTAALRPRAADAREHTRQFELQNSQVAWRLQSTSGEVRSIAFENRVSGPRFALHSKNEFRRIVSRDRELRSPGWNFPWATKLPYPRARQRSRSGFSPSHHCCGGLASGRYPLRRTTRTHLWRLRLVPLQRRVPRNCRG
jgi:hypothetical protein